MSNQLMDFALATEDFLADDLGLFTMSHPYTGATYLVVIGARVSVLGPALNATERMNVMKTRTLAPGAYLTRNKRGASLHDANGRCFPLNKMSGSILALALAGLSAEGIADALRHYFNGNPTQSRDAVVAWLDEMEASGFLKS